MRKKSESFERDKNENDYLTIPLRELSVSVHSLENSLNVFDPLTVTTELIDEIKKYLKSYRTIISEEVLPGTIRVGPGKEEQEFRFLQTLLNRLVRDVNRS